MQAMKSKAPALLLAAMLGVAGTPASAGEPDSAPAPRAAVDPMVQALIAGIAASLLRGMAANPADPLAGAGASIERGLRELIESPAPAIALEQILKDVPAELRDPLRQLLLRLLDDVRIEMSRNVPPRGMLRIGAPGTAPAND
ncbi:MAG TPA: hypothetical protein VMK05_03905 [Burkholderiales bacterium]|nr:hypothetical protein [Burkholderiales bacterium]